VQKEKNIDYVAIPLDVVKALDGALKKKHPLIIDRKYYKKISNSF